MVTAIDLYLGDACEGSGPFGVEGGDPFHRYGYDPRQGGSGATEGNQEPFVSCCGKSHFFHKGWKRVGGLVIFKP